VQYECTTNPSQRRNNAGNELTRVSTISGDTANGTTTFAYDALDRLTTYTPRA
jgi:YD repeat-containing protein